MTRMSGSCRAVSVSFLLLASPGPLSGQTLPEEILTQVLQGASGLVMDEKETSVLLLGSPTLPLVEVNLNGAATAQFLVDLGSNVVIVRQDVLERGAGTVLFARESRDIGQFASFRIGAAEYQNVTVGVYPELDVDGVIGYNLLKYSSFTLDYPGREFSLHRRALPDPASAADVLPYTAADNVPMVEVMLDGTLIVVNLDTGASEWMTVPPQLAERLAWSSKPAPGRTVWNNQTGDVRILEGRARGALVLGPLAIDTLLIYVNEDAEHPWLGSSAMNPAVWEFDPENLRLRITIPAARAFHQERGGPDVRRR